NQIEVFIVDPLITLHSVPESDNGKMDQVVRILLQIADDCDASVDFAHHTRKLAAGVSEATANDSRGASAIPHAVRLLETLNVMSLAEPRQLGIDEFERLLYFRSDQGKANTSRPAAKADWYRFESIDLANGDNVGVVTPWNRPDSGDGSAAARKADDTFLLLLDRMIAEGRYVNDRGGTTYAPAAFAKHPEAKALKVNKRALEDAMHRLFAAGHIKVEDYRAADRHTGRRIVRCETEAAE